MRRTKDNVCEIIKVICPYLLSCSECDVHCSYERAYKRSMNVHPEQHVKFIQDAHREE